MFVLKTNESTKNLFTLLSLHLFLVQSTLCMDQKTIAEKTSIKLMPDEQGSLFLKRPEPRIRICSGNKEIYDGKPYWAMVTAIDFETRLSGPICIQQHGPDSPLTPAILDKADREKIYAFFASVAKAHPSLCISHLNNIEAPHCLSPNEREEILMLKRLYT